MKKAVGWLIIAGLTMYFIPQMWYVILAILFGLLFLTIALVLLVFMAKALGIAVGEWAIIRWLLKKSKA